MLFKHLQEREVAIIQEREVAILRCSFTWNPWKLFVKKLFCNEVARSQPASLRKKNSFTYPPSCILSSFFRNASRLLLPRRLWKCASTISFRNYKWKVVLLVIYLFNYDSSKSTFLMLNMAFDVLFKMEFFVSCNTI